LTKRFVPAGVVVSAHWLDSILYNVAEDEMFLHSTSAGDKFELQG